MQTLKGHSACRIFIIFIFWPIHWYGVLETLNTHQKDIACDELLSDSFPCKELENGMLWEVQRKWVVQGAIDVDIGTNPYAEGGCEDEGVDDQAIKIVDIVDTFRLQEQTAFDKK